MSSLLKLLAILYCQSSVIYFYKRDAPFSTVHWNSILAVQLNTLLTYAALLMVELPGFCLR